MGQQIEELRGVAKLDIREFLTNAKRVVDSARDMATGARNAMVDFATSFTKGGRGARGAAIEVEHATDKIVDAVQDAAVEVEQASEAIAESVDDGAEIIAQASDEMIRDFHDVRDEAGRFMAKPPRSGLAMSFDGLRQNARDLLTEVTRVAARVTTAIVAMSTAATGAVGAAGFSFLALKEQSQIAFTTMLGDGQRAKAFLVELEQFAATTPFEFPGLIQSAQKLLAMGFAAEDVLPMLTSIGDATAALGGSPELLGRITTVLGQMKQKGKVQAEEMLQLAEAGIPAWDMLAKKLGVDIPTAMSMVTKGMVSADVAIEALLSGMNSKFGGLMAQQSKTFSGMLSTMKDNARSAAAFIVEPMFKAVTGIMSDLMGGSGAAEVSKVMREIRTRVSEAATALRAFVAENKSEIIRQFAESLRWVVNATIQIAQYLREVGPPLAGVVRAFLEWGGALAQLAGQIPYVKELLAILAVGHLTGITGAISALVRVIISLVTGLGSAAAAAGVTSGALGGTLATAATAAATALGAVGLALGGIVAIGAVVFFANLAAEASKLNAQMRETLASMDRMRDKATADAEKRIEDARASGGAAGEAGALRARRDSLARLKASQERQAASAASAATAAQSESEKRRELFGSSFFGGVAARIGDAAFGSDADIKAKEAERAKQDLARTERELAETDRRLKEAERAAAAEKAAFRGVAGVSPAGGVAGSGATPAAAPTKEQADLQKRVDEFFGELAIAARSVPANEVAEIRAKFDALVQQLQAGTISVDTFNSQLSQLTNEAVNASDTLAKEAEKLRADAASRALPSADMAHQLKSMRGTVPAGSQALMEQSFVNMQQGTAAGTISHAEWQRGMGMLNTGSTAAQGFSQSLSQAQAGLPTGVSLDPEKVAVFNAQFDALLTSFMSGAMGAERFNAETRKLSDSMRQAAADAEKEAMAKQRQQMLAPFQGLLAQAQAQGANPMMQRALEDRLLQLQQQRLSQQIDGAVNGFLKVNGVLGDFSTQMRGVGDQVQQFGTNLSQGSQVSADRAREGFGQFFGWLNSAGGQIASLQNQIQFAYQRLAVVRNKDNRLASQILDQINSMTAEINRLMTPQTPLFSEVNGANVSIDPGLQTRSSGGTSVSMEFPNLTRLSNSDVQRVAVALDYELRRKGKRV